MPLRAGDTALPAWPKLVAALSEASAGEVVRFCEASGVDPRLGQRAAFGRMVNASAFLSLCHGLGIDPSTGDDIAPARVGELLWWFLGASVNVTRRLGGLSVRAAAVKSGVSSATISRIECGQPVSAASVVALCRFIGLPPKSFTGNTNCNSLIEKEAA